MHTETYSNAWIENKTKQNEMNEPTKDLSWLFGCCLANCTVSPAIYAMIIFQRAKLCHRFRCCVCCVWVCLFCFSSLASRFVCLCAFFSPSFSYLIFRIHSDILSSGWHFSLNVQSNILYLTLNFAFALWTNTHTQIHLISLLLSIIAARTGFGSQRKIRNKNL